MYNRFQAYTAAGALALLIIVVELGISEVSAQDRIPGPPAATPPPPAITPPPAATPPGAAPAPNAPRLRPGEVLFNFQDADIQAVVKTVSQLTGRNFLVDPRVKGKVTIISVKPMSANAAYQVFLSALKAQGFAAVEGPGGVVKIVPEAEGKQNATVSPGAVPGGGDQLVTQVVVVQNGSATQMVPLLRPLMSPTALLSVYAPANTLVITDYADNIRRLLRIIDKIDQPGSADVSIVPLNYASAVDMAQLLARLGDVPSQLGQPQVAGQITGEAARLNVVPDMRTNSLLIRTDNQGRLDQLRGLIAKLDVPAKPGGNTRVVYLRNAEAVKLAEILRGLLAGEARTQAAATPGLAVPGGTATAVSARPAEASLVQADEASNSLVISATDAVYNNLRAVIDKLDIRRAQVYVEALIAEVTSDKASQFGIQWAGARAAGEGAIAAVQNFPITGSGIVDTAINPLGLGAGLSVGFIGKTITLADGRQVRGLGALVRFLEDDNNANILSTPTLLTLDNAEAKIVVGQNVPFLTGRFAQATSATPGAAVNPFQTIERKDVGLTLRLKPQISEGEGIKLQIFQEVSSVARATEGAQDLVTNKRSLETTVLVDNDHTVVLGGLIDDNVQENIQAVPLLSSIPILGELFKYRERRKKKTNLMIFLRPVIVRDVKDSQGFTGERYEYIRSEQRRSRMDWAVPLPRYPSPILPPLVQPPPKAPPETAPQSPASPEPAPDVQATPPAAEGADSPDNPDKPSL